MGRENLVRKLRIVLQKVKAGDTFNPFGKPLDPDDIREMIRYPNALESSAVSTLETLLAQKGI